MASLWATGAKEQGPGPRKIVALWGPLTPALNPSLWKGCLERDHCPQVENYEHHRVFFP